MRLVLLMPYPCAHCIAHGITHRVSDTTSDCCAYRVSNHVDLC